MADRNKEVEVTIFEGTPQPVKGLFRGKYEEVHVKKRNGETVVTVPEGANGAFQINGTVYRVRNFRERPGHTAGAIIETDGFREPLDPQETTKAVDRHIFRYGRRRR